jgi:predicted acylesterase/phospholipase RssA
MTRSDYTRAVWDIVHELEEFKEQKGDRFVYSNLVDEEGHQYVDLVQEGGGVLGMALVGFTYVLEELGFRFLSLAGTSAGAINTLLLASLKEKEENGRRLTKSEQIIEELAAVNFMDFVDGGQDAVRLAEIISGRGPKSSFRKMLAFLENISEIRNDLAINPGEKFFEWLDGIFPHKTTKSLIDQLHDLPVLYRKDWKTDRKTPAGKVKTTLAIISADVTTQSKAVFPEMAGLYYPDPDVVNPVNYVRASMSVPLFFKPYTISSKKLLEHHKEEDLRKKWKTKMGYEGPIPPEFMLVDGGIMSNFPIDCLYSPYRILDRPIIGIKLGVDRNKHYENKSISQFLGNCFEGARNIADFGFLFKNPNFKELISYVDVGNHHWLDFSLSEEARIDLFRKGAKAAYHFIRRFDWPEYQRKVRGNLLREAMAMNSGLLQTEDIKHKLGFDKGPVLDKIEKYMSADSSREVLWIDDDYTNDALELLVLERMNFNVTLASSTREARIILERRASNNGRPPFDLIITDSNRGGYANEGIQFCEELNKDERFTAIPVLLHSKTWKEGLRQKGVKLPENIKNSRNRNLLRLNDLIEEVARVVG